MTPTFETSIDRYIFKAIRRCTPKQPQTLTGIVGAVDAIGRLVVSHRELSGGLERLIAAGYVTEIGKHRFYDATGEEPGDKPRMFSGLTDAEHDAAVDKYVAAFRRLAKQLDDEEDDEGFAERKLVLRWATPGGRYCTDEDEDAAEKLADEIEPVIAASGLGEINGFELGTGHADILIFGPTDQDVDEIYQLLAPAFRTYGCPPGSSIIRFYPDERREVESDVVPDAG